jgi:hypothetical protein
MGLPMKRFFLACSFVLFAASAQAQTPVVAKAIDDTTKATVNIGDATNKGIRASIWFGGSNIDPRDVSDRSGRLLGKVTFNGTQDINVTNATLAVTQSGAWSVSVSNLPGALGSNGGVKIDFAKAVPYGSGSNAVGVMIVDPVSPSDIIRVSGGGHAIFLQDNVGNGITVGQATPSSQARAYAVRALLPHNEASTQPINGNGQGIDLGTLDERYGTVTFEVNGSWTGTLEFQGRAAVSDAFKPIACANAATLVPTTTTTANGLWSCPAAGLGEVQIASTAWSSGTANITTAASAISGPTLMRTLTTSDTVTVGSSVLPSGAATGVKQDTGNTSLASIDTKLTSPLSVTGPLTDAQMRATPVPVSTASLPLPTGAATEATLAAIAANTPAPITGGGPVYVINPPALKSPFRCNALRKTNCSVQ